MPAVRHPCQRARLIEGKHGCVVGLVKSDITFTPYVEVVTQRKTIDQDLFRLLKMLAV